MPIEGDVSRVVGTTTIRFRERDWLLDNFGFQDWSAIQSRLVRDKRARMIQAATDAAEGLSAEQAAMVRQEAIEASSNIAGLTQQEFTQILSQPAGMARFFWVMFERRYPGKFQTEDIEQMIRDGLIDEQKTIEVIDAIKFALGMDDAKKKTVQV